MNWLFTAIASIIGSIILSIVGNLLTDPIKNWLARRSLISKRKRATTLRHELDYVIKLAHDDRALFLESNLAIARSVLFLFWAIAAGIFGTASLVMAIPARNPLLVLVTLNNSSHPNVFFVSAVLAEALGAMLFVAGTNSIGNHYNLFRKIKNLETYKHDIERRIQELSK
jgi:hypothetical protein